MDCSDFLDWVKERNPGLDEFHQAVAEVAPTIWPLIRDNKAYQENRIFERLCEPDRMISFRVTWEDDEGAVQVNRGWRVQHSNALGAYKGGLRFHPSVCQSVLQFLAFEQCFKNALTGLPMGGAKGGADFDPKGRSDREIARFCRAFMAELYRHIGPDIDIPAGDIGVSDREIGYLFGTYKKLSNVFQPALTGKAISYGGSPMRTEATGYGLVYFVCRMLQQAGETIENKTVTISGAGNVAIHAAEKALGLGARVLCVSDSKGCLHDPDGLDQEKIDRIKAAKAQRGAHLADIAAEFDLNWLEGKTPWHISCDIALPCATQNEIGQKDAEHLISGGCIAVGEGANMPCTDKAVKAFKEADILFAPGKAANAGGVALSGLEISQNIVREKRSREDLANRLQEIMDQIHDRCVAESPESEPVDYVTGANRAGFKRLAEAMLAYGSE